MDTLDTRTAQEGSRVPRLLKVRQVCDLLQIHPATWRRAVKRGLAPAPVLLPVGEGRQPQAHRWDADDVREYVQRLKATATGAAGQ